MVGKTENRRNKRSDGKGFAPRSAQAMGLAKLRVITFD
jgi:hypothetical protein